MDNFCSNNSGILLSTSSKIQFDKSKFVSNLKKLKNFQISWKLNLKLS